MTGTGLQGLLVSFLPSLTHLSASAQPKCQAQSLQSSVSFAGCWVGDWRALGGEGEVLCMQRESHIKHRPAAEWLEQWVRGAQGGSRS